MNTTTEKAYIDPDREIDMLFKKRDMKNVVAQKKQENSPATIAKKYKLAVVLAYIVCMASFVLLYNLIMQAVYSFMYADIYNFVCLGIAVGFTMLCIFGVIYGYIKDKIKN